MNKSVLAVVLFLVSVTGWALNAPDAQAVGHGRAGCSAGYYGARPVRGFVRWVWGAERRADRRERRAARHAAYGCAGEHAAASCAGDYSASCSGGYSHAAAPAYEGTPAPLTADCPIDPVTGERVCPSPPAPPQ